MVNLKSNSQGVFLSLEKFWIEPRTYLASISFKSKSSCTRVLLLFGNDDCRRVLGFVCFWVIEIFPFGRTLMLICRLDGARLISALLVNSELKKCLNKGFNVIRQAQIMLILSSRSLKILLGKKFWKPPPSALAQGDGKAHTTKS